VILQSLCYLRMRSDREVASLAQKIICVLKVSVMRVHRPGAILLAVLVGGAVLLSGELWEEHGRLGPHFQVGRCCID
jgi:hypothetical protein